MKLNDRSLLDRATGALRSDIPDAEAITASAARAAQKLGIEMSHEALTSAIRNCDDVQQLLSSYRAGTLPEARVLLVQAHLQDCGVCLRRFREGREGATLDWAAPLIAPKSRRHPQAWGWALAFSSVLLISALFVYKAYWQVPP
jgi:hypothetical protein